MKLLRILTLSYVAVLVAALASSLVAIGVNLRRVAKSLGEVRSALSVVGDQTKSLERPLQQLDESSASSAKDLADAREKLNHADEQLAEIVERLGVTERAP